MMKARTGGPSLRQQVFNSGAKKCIELKHCEREVTNISLRHYDINEENVPIIKIG